MLQKIEQNSNFVINKITEQKCLIELLKNEITQYRKKNPRLSLRGIATKDLTLSREFVRKLANGSLLEKNLDKYQVLKILTIISNKNTFQEIANSFCNEIKTYLTESFKAFYNENATLLDNTVESILSGNEIDSIVFTLVANDNGIESDRLFKIMGERGILSANDFVIKGIFSIENGIYQMKYKKDVSIFSPSLQTTKILFNNYSQFYKLSHVGKKRNFIIAKSGKLNKEGLEKKQQKYIELHEWLQNLYATEKYKGEELAFDACMMDTFNSDEDCELFIESNGIELDNCEFSFEKTGEQNE